MGIVDRSAILAPAASAGGIAGDLDSDREVWEKPIDVNCIMSEEELRGIRGAQEEGNELKVRLRCSMTCHEFPMRYCMISRGSSTLQRESIVEALTMNVCC